MERVKVNKEEMDNKWALPKFHMERGIYIPPREATDTINYSDGIEVENYILTAIKNADDISYDSPTLMHAVKDWPSYYHLGIGRANILRALDLSTNIEVLEFGSGCGAVTRYLGENFELVNSIEGSPLRARITRERCRDLGNVKVFCSNFEHIKFDPTYDVVTLIGVLEYAPKYFLEPTDADEPCLSLLKVAKTALKEDGILIIAIENKIGVKYWGGYPEEHTGEVFDSIHGYPEKQGPITFSKKEIRALLEAAGFPNISFYYCFPDYKFASTLISDIGDEKGFYLHNWIDVPFASYNLPRTYTFHEGLVIKTLSESGLLREFANSFLIVASQSDTHIISQPEWIAKRFSIRRRREFQCVTTLRIKPKIYVGKERISHNREDYIVRNNNIEVKHRIADSPWYEGDLMSFDMFKMLFSRDFKSNILKMLKEYYRELIGRFYTGIDDEEGFPLLQGNSVDFIFRNMISEEKGEPIYIDNEWYVAGYIPADYVMYRCIATDIIGAQYPWIRKKVRNTDKFTIELIKSFFPSYGNHRHNRNKVLEESFQKLVTGGLNEIILMREFQFLRKVIAWNLTKKIWIKLPEGAKLKIRKLVS